MIGCGDASQWARHANTTRMIMARAKRYSDSVDDARARRASARPHPRLASGTR
jgi:hypothetical protein